MKLSHALLPLAMGSAVAMPITNLHPRQNAKNLLDLVYQHGGVIGLIKEVPKDVQIVGLSNKLDNLMDHGRIGP
ncbi:hypothetical protein ATEIFO6365_0001010700 [Aspergillus terreus]|uniref:Uncharacterized protein n=1 Tax=Aspergillus terreus TaxID=33178 RepID=A0A5M3YQ64_ASPTE|nr:hypothetical protein ATETN484_0001010600 [Aspergillus terreus]GFF11887.1 hypothetical protein ATEIFO6365_0001010700 [Aspergillus terreus]